MNGLVKFIINGGVTLNKSAFFACTTACSTWMLKTRRHHFIHILSYLHLLLPNPCYSSTLGAISLMILWEENSEIGQIFVEEIIFKVYV